MIAPDDTTFAYLEGRPAAPRGADWEQRARRAGARSRSDDDAVFDREVEIDVARARAAGHLGDEPGDGRAGGRRRARSRRLRRPRRARGRRARARLHGARAGHADRATSASTASSSARARTPGSRTCARRQRSSPGRRVHPRVRAMVVPGSAAVKRQAEDEGLDRVFERRRLRVAARRLLDVPRHEPGHPRAGRALRLDLEPQLRGPAGRAAAARTSSARRWPPRPRSPATSSTCAS